MSDERTMSRPRSDTLVDALDRLLDVGVVAAGDLTLSVAGVDLIYVNLRALLSSVETIERTARESRRIPDDGPVLRPIEAQAGLARPGEARSDARASHDFATEPFDDASDPSRLSADLGEGPEDMERGLAGLIVVLIDLLRQLLERQAIRRMEGGSLTEEQVERLGRAFMRLEQRVEDLKRVFGLGRDERELPDVASLLDHGRNGPGHRKLPGPYSGPS